MQGAAIVLKRLLALPDPLTSGVSRKPCPIPLHWAVAGL